MFHPKSIQNNDHIELHQKIHCDFTINAPIVLTKKQTNPNQ